MFSASNIVIADETALHAFLHSNGKGALGAQISMRNPLSEEHEGTATLNEQNPLYGPSPIHLLTNDEASRTRRPNAVVRSCTSATPEDSFWKLRDGLYLTSPRLTLVRMACFLSEMQLAEAAMNLCARYYLHPVTGEILDRSEYLTTPQELAAFAKEAAGTRGASKTTKALRWVLPNSGSPMETKMYLQFCAPHRKGAFALPFDQMNYNIQARRLASLMEQESFCVDMAHTDSHKAIEYDGKDYHTDPAKDKRRRNALAATGWTVYPIDSSVLYDPDATWNFGCQMAKILGIRLRLPADWEAKYVKLREDLGLPA